MEIRELLDAKVVDLMAGVDLDRRYYGYFEACRHRPRTSTLRKADFSAALATAELPFRYRRAEDFFQCFEEQARIGTGLNVAFPHGNMMELILVTRVHGMHVGGPFHVLAHDISARRDPDFAYDPRYPRLPVTNHDELADAVRFAMALFNDARSAIAKYPGWDAIVAGAVPKGPSGSPDSAGQRG